MIIIANVVFCAALVLVALTNYPGGLAITKFHKLLKNEPFVHVHIYNLTIEETTNESDKEISKVITEIDEEIKFEDNIVEDFIQKPKKATNDFKSYRQERKKKAADKIKSETRRAVVASAKEKLREIMKRHKHIADGLSGTVISDHKIEVKKEDGRGDTPEIETVLEEETTKVVSEPKIESEPIQDENVTVEKFIENADNRTNENVDAIVEEVIVRLIDRKIYDDKTKPEDIKGEDRQIIQKIVEEVLAEKMSYNSSKENKINISI
ncbi:unnamed protein product, partial [Iphiclides podalirius]